MGVSYSIEDICKNYHVNDEQARALDITENIALRAGAGSGKTRVLTKRFIKTLLENKDISIENIVAITFTKKAATEMKDRIRKELAEKKIRMSLSNANIDTIHGFCGKLLRDNFALLGIDPDFEILEEVDKQLILSRLADEMITEFIEKYENKEVVTKLAENYSTTLFSGTLKFGIIKAFSDLKEKGFDSSRIGGSKPKEDCIEPHEILEFTASILITNLERKYSEHKDSENLLDFNDLENMTVKLLNDDEICDTYFEYFKVIMVDEFQDVNPLQKQILDKLILRQGSIPKGRLFIVGDHKQSIYGFRGSDYRVFEETCETIAQNGKVEFLNNCYRSTPNIINSVNAIFSKLLQPYEALKYPGHQMEQQLDVDLITWEKSEIKDKKVKGRWDNAKDFIPNDSLNEQLKKTLLDQYENELNVGKKGYQGDVVAGKILELKKKGFEYKDFAILMRSRTSLSNIEAALEKKNIPYCVLGGIGFWERQEINDLLALYKYIFDPKDMLSLMTVLRSPIFGFSDDMLLGFSMFLKENLLKNHDEFENIEDTFYKYAYTVQKREYPLVLRAAEIFEKISKLDGILNTAELMNAIIFETSFDEVLAALPQGEKKLRNLEKLLQITLEFEAKGRYSAREFIEYFEILKETSAMGGEAFLDSEDSDAVKILTIHASKGLEFKAVIIPDMDASLDSISKRNKPLFFVDIEDGLVAIGTDDEGKLNEEVNPKYQVLYSKKLSRELEDSRRVFYVATTRAEKYLGLIGESQELKEEALDAQNSFMKQLKWAIQANEEFCPVKETDAFSLLSDETEKKEYPPAYLNVLAGILSETGNEDCVIKSLEACENEIQGNISISAWMKYRDCPRKYYFENLTGLMDDKRLNEIWDGELEDEKSDFDEDKNKFMTGADFGTFVHGFLEKLDMTTVDVNGLLDSENVRNVLVSDISEKDKDLFIKCLNGFIEIEKRKSEKNAVKLVASLKEFEFRVPISKGVNLLGFIDRIDVFEMDGKYQAVVIDYKTNKVDEQHGIEDKVKFYEAQLTSYAWVLEQIPFYRGQKVEVVEAQLYFVYSGNVERVDLEKERQSETIACLVNDSPWLLGTKKLGDYGCEMKLCEWCECENLCKNVNQNHKF